MDNIKRIPSFTVNHNVLEPGFYISRIDGDITTYDLRTRKPNADSYMDHSTMHTAEHMFATLIRNSEIADDVVYFGPMGCRTGFYFLTTGMTHAEAIELTKAALDFIKDYDGEIPGATAVECGNYREHDLAGAKNEAAMQAEVLKNWTDKDLYY